jgi:NADH dehydrogenase
MATITRFSAVAKVGRLQMAGFLAWVMWLVVHLMYLVGFKNRLTTLLHWTVSFVGRTRSERTTTAQQVVARNRLRQMQGQQPVWPGAVGERPTRDDRAGHERVMNDGPTSGADHPA